MPTTEEIIANYIDRRDRIAEISARHAEELRPLQEAQQQLENYFLHMLNERGEDSIKCKGAGTVYKKNATSVTMADAAAFKAFIFGPAINGVCNYLQSAGYPLREVDCEAIQNAVLGMLRWDMVDFRTGKKGIQEYLDNEKQPVPGVNISTVATVQIRRA